MITQHAILLIKKQDKLLVVKDKEWGCLLFPHFRYENSINAGDVFQYVNDTFGYVKARYVKAFSEQVKKKNAPATKSKEYWHNYYLIEVPDNDVALADDNLSNCAEEYVWRQLDELREDEVTCKYNAEVIDSVEEYFRRIEDGFSYSCR